jgi:hypothetical protein
VARRGFYKAQKSNRLRVRYRSWNPELWLMKQLDADPLVSMWLYEEFRVDYTDWRGRARWTVPDFLVVFNGRLLVIEGKAHNRVKRFVKTRKYKATVRWCERAGIPYRIVTNRYPLAKLDLQALLYSSAVSH